MKITKSHKLIAKRMLGYRKDPAGFIKNCLGVEHFWPKMEEVANSVRDNMYTAVPACHSVSKTYGAARIAVWFKTCFQPSTVVTTAPSDTLVKNQLWKEIHAAYSGSKIPLGGKMTTLTWDCKPSPAVLKTLPPEKKGQWEKNFAMGFATSPDTATEQATKMQGFHNEWMLIIFDEACGIIRPIWKAATQGLMVNSKCRFLAIGNPTDPTGYFYKICQPESKWNVISISVKDTPNYKEDKEIIPSVAGRMYYNDMKAEHGEDSNTFKVRVLGEFPTYLEGTFYGDRMAQLERNDPPSIGDYPWEENTKVYTFGDYGDIYTAIIFVQFIQSTIRIIDFYYDNDGVGVSGYAKMMDTKPYVYASRQGHWAGWDLDPSTGSNRKRGGKTVKDHFAELGYDMRSVEKSSFNDGIEDVRGIFNKLRINKRNCKDLITALQKYRKKKNEQLSTDDKPAYHREPVKDWTCHVADAVRHLARAYRWHLYIDGVPVGVTKTYAPYYAGVTEESGDWNPLEV
jgi:hypothetical protein